MSQDHKDVTIGDSLYRIGLLKAADGSWIYSTFVKRYRAYQETQPAPIPLPSDAPPAPDVPVEAGLAMTASFLTEQLSRTELAEVQNICLSVCGKYSSATGNPVAMPILLSDGRFSSPDMAYDGPTVLELTKQSIAFNIAPFFPGAGSSGSTSPADLIAQSTQP